MTPLRPVLAGVHTQTLDELGVGWASGTLFESDQGCKRCNESVARSKKPHGVTGKVDWWVERVESRSSLRSVARGSWAQSGRTRIFLGAQESHPGYWSGEAKRS
jgi:hypothetical protein